ncbi:probable kinetochore protein nuf2 isoform X2 [Belonocnema kinseyi]|nr:probable kinetochore protein nuf2 isoform X2 [Belonocnema kinseyi]
MAEKQSSKQDGADFNIFSAVGLPVTERDLAKPSKDFVIILIAVFFNKFHIDGNIIKQPLEKQIKTLNYQDIELYEEVIKITNMHVAMSGIYEKIYVKDFQFIDITSPSPKKTMKMLNLLANFVLYYNNKLPEIEYNLNNIIDRREATDKAIQEKNAALDALVRSKSYRENQSDYNEKLRKKIEAARKRTEKLTAKMDEKRKEVRLIEKEKQILVQVYGDKKSEALEVTRHTAEVQAQVVESPEGLIVQLQELEKQKEFKIAESELKYDSIKEKKKLIELKEDIQAFVQKAREEMTKLKELQHEKRNLARQLENLNKEQEDIRNTIHELKKEREIQKNHSSDLEIDELNLEIEKRLSPMRNKYVQLFQ